MKPSLIIAISLFAFPLSVQASTLSLEKCAAIEDPVERLACYDTLADRSPANRTEASGTAPGEADPVVPRAAAIEPAATPVPSVKPAAPAVKPAAAPVKLEPDAEAIFGFEHKPRPDEKPIDELKIKWTNKKKDSYGKWIITLENGQVWRQTDSRRFNFVNSEQWAVITRGVFGTFFMGEPEPGRKKRIRVKRVK